MVKLLICEDEAIERKALRFLIGKFYKDKIEIVGEASNGEEVVEKAFTLQPDIILMDIQMPKTNGIDASKEIKKHLKEVNIIILTAYSQFEYAKEGIKIGVKDYLLKPVSNSELQECIDNIFQVIAKRREKREKELGIKNKIEKLRYLLEEEIILQIINGKDYEGIEKNLNLAGFDEKNVFGILIKCHEKDVIKLEEEYKNIKRNLYRIYDKVLGYIFLGEFFFLVFGDELTKNKEILSLLENTKEDSKAYFLSEIRPVSSVYEIYKELKNVSQSSKHYERPSYPFEKKKELCASLLGGDIENALSVLDEIIVFIENEYTSNHTENLKNHIRQIYTLIHRQLGIVSTSEAGFELEKSQEELMLCKDKSEIRRYSQNLMKNIVYKFEEAKKGRNEEVIEFVKDYIRKNYKEDISLADLSTKIGISSHYLSRLYKKYENENYKDYLTKIRMEEAKKLIKGKKLSIKEISYEIGYSDPNYFSRAFKKYTGISATDYLRY